MMDLKPYIGKGFPGDYDRMIAEVPVKGIDGDQTRGQIRLCPQTEAALYGPEYSPQRLRYRRGSRPELEKIVAGFTGTPLQRVEQAVRWVIGHVVHPHLVRMLEPDRAMSEESLIGSGIGWCNEQTRVFIALCEVMEIPARVCFVFHANLRSGHTCAEVFVENRWAFVDVTFEVIVRLPDGRLAEGRDLSGKFRELAHAAYRPRLEAYFKQVKPYVETCPGWRSADRPTVDAGGDLLAHVGIVNYVIEGCEVLR